MDDLISRKAAIYIASGYCHPSNIAKELAKLPAIKPKRGKWIPKYYDVGADVYVEWSCSECGYVRQKGREDGNAGEEPEADFCEKCGVKMERKDDGTD